MTACRDFVLSPTGTLQIILLKKGRSRTVRNLHFHVAMEVLSAKFYMETWFSSCTFLRADWFRIPQCRSSSVSLFSVVRSWARYVYATCAMHELQRVFIAGYKWATSWQQQFMSWFNNCCFMCSFFQMFDLFDKVIEFNHNPTSESAKRRLDLVRPCNFLCHKRLKNINWIELTTVEQS